MKQFLIYWGVGGGYGGIHYSALINSETIEEAIHEAYERAVEDCASYGIEGTTWDEELQEEVGENPDDWADYRVEEYTGDLERLEDAKGYHFQDET